MVAMVPRTIRLPGRIWNELDAIAVRDGVSTSEVVKEACIRLCERDYLERKKPPPKKGRG